MKFDFISFMTNPFVPIFLATLIGLSIGKIKIGKFNLGQSGGLFSGIVIGWALYAKYIEPYMDPKTKALAKNAPKAAASYLKTTGLYDPFFTFTLLLFIAAVGLLASKDLIVVVKKYGAKFILLSGIITGTGMLLILAATKIFAGQNHFAISGTYTGALTSSPGLAAALEAVKQYGADAQAQVGMGHAIAYAPGVLMVILVMNFFPVIFKIDIEKEKERFRLEMGSFAEKEAAATGSENKVKEVGLDLVALSFVILVGYIIGTIQVYLPFIHWVSLASTGGVLISSLVLGSMGKLGPLTFRMNSKILSAVRDLSLSVFLAIVGLEYGYNTVHALSGSGAFLAILAFCAGLGAMLVGYLVGRYVFKLNWIILAGAMCGGATSTPGLGAAIDSTHTDEVAAGYGATYPFGLLFKVIFVILLHKLA